MKITKLNIQEINGRLKKHGVNYVDIRYELIDHFVEELITIEGNFDDDFDSYFKSKMEMIQKIQRANFFRNGMYGLDYLLKELLSIRFIISYATITSGLYFLTIAYGKQTLLESIDVLPFIIPTPISLIVLYNIFYKKEFTAKSESTLFSVNMLIIFYLSFGIHMVRKIENLGWLIMFSFFITLAFYDYYIFFKVRKDDKKYLKHLLS